MRDFSLRIGEFEVPLPIIQGGMGVGISLSGLASAVANAGGVGVIAAAGIGMLEMGHLRPKEADPVALRQEIKKARALAPDGVLGVNVMVAMTRFEDLVRVSIEEGADLIISGAGLPLSLPGIKSDYAGAETALVPIVSSARAAALLCKRWERQYRAKPDAFVVEGPLAGGHLGFREGEIDSPQNRLENIVRGVLEVAESCGGVPVVAAGGIWDGGDIARFLEMGAAGVQMGTRFVATEECDASPEFKEAYLRAKGTVIVKSPVGMPARAIPNEFLRRVDGGETVPTRCPFRCIATCKPREAPYCIARALVNAQRGELAEGVVFAGANVSKVKEITTVPKLMEELAAGAGLSLSRV